MQSYYKILSMNLEKGKYHKGMIQKPRISIDLEHDLMLIVSANLYYTHF